MKSDYLIVSNAIKFMQEDDNIVKVSDLTLSMVLSDAVGHMSAHQLGDCEGFNPQAFATERVIRRAHGVLYDDSLYPYNDYSSPFQSITDAQAIEYLKVLKRHFR